MQITKNKSIHGYFRYPSARSHSHYAEQSDQATSNLDSKELVSALGSMFGDGDGKLNFGTILSNMQQGGLAHVVSSWLGNGTNAPISPETAAGLVDTGKIEAFASRFGLSAESAKNAIASALPAMVDNASPDGSLFEGIIGKAGWLGGLSDMVNKFF